MKLKNPTNCDIYIGMMSKRTAHYNQNPQIATPKMPTTFLVSLKLPKAILSTDRQQATGNRQQATGNRQQATGNRQQATLYTSSK